MAEYNKYYLQENLFGEPYKELLEFFNNYEPKGKLLDIGCGQGRDSIPLAEMGYKVTGIDNSSVGIKQMLEKAKKKKLKITGIVLDMYSFNDFSKYSIILLNSMIHFEKNDLEKESEYLRNIWDSVKPKSMLGIFILANKKKEQMLRDLFAENSEVLCEQYLDYVYVDGEHKSKSKYLMYCVKKTA